MKKIISLILIFAMLITLLTGCSFSSDPKSTDNSQATTSSSNVGNTSPLRNIDQDNSGDYNPVDADGIDWSKYDWDNFDETDLRVDIGKASFTVDNSACAIGDFTPGQPLSLSVTDGAGATWRLDIPSNGLLVAETITITALADVTTDGSFGKLDGGLLMEPDGLMFFAPAMLTVSGIGYGEKSVLFTAGHDGSNLDIPYYETSIGSATTYVSHFSSVGSKMSYGESGEMLVEISERKLTKAQKAATELLKKPNYMPDEEPPSAWFENCDEKLPDLTDFLNAFNKPEKDIAIRLLEEMEKAGNELDKKLGNTNASDVNIKQYTDDFVKSAATWAGNLALAMALLERLGEKANKLIEEYKYKPEKFYAVAYAASFYNILFGVNAVNQGEINTWWQKTWNYHMDKLSGSHNFCKVNALKKITNIGAWAGANVKGWEEKLSNALTFEPHFTIVSGLAGGAMFVRATGEAEDLRIDHIDDISDVCWGEATGRARYTSFTVAGNATVDKPEYEFFAKLTDLDPCGSKTVKLGVKDFGPETDHFYETRSGQNYGSIAASSYVSMLIAGAFAQSHFVANEGGYVFTLKLNSGQEMCAEETFQGGTQYNIDLDLNLYHTPKGDMYY